MAKADIVGSWLGFKFLNALKDRSLPLEINIQHARDFSRGEKAYVTTSTRNTDLNLERGKEIQFASLAVCAQEVQDKRTGEVTQEATDGTVISREVQDERTGNPLRKRRKGTSQDGAATRRDEWERGINKNCEFNYIRTIFRVYRSVQTPERRFRDLVPEAYPIQYADNGVAIPRNADQVENLLKTYAKGLADKRLVHIMITPDWPEHLEQAMTRTALTEKVQDNLERLGLANGEEPMEIAAFSQHKGEHVFK
ncbi:hypothetical protein CAPTEDRAFT_213752 [Capitella teleta]|uniref:Uncharacterized protein n=1 Tax=Capitella teleta TaxID=283909 RepID=R7V924_CAPTE|nr:hypothetical protein CAPTEDRAFT_213752 [Capitella teleta]|eukprot:ELU12215.1 hypothetical protein CAPTEDRAFT_213752 [Capitella teleta]